MIKMERIISVHSFSLEDAAKTSESLGRLVKWVLGEHSFKKIIGNNKIK